MSASKEKKIRKEQRTAADWVDTKAIQQEKDKKALKKTNLIFAVVAVLFVAVGIFSVIWNGGFLQKGADAVTINGESFSPAEAEFYYTSSYQNFVEQNYYYLAYYGLSTTTSLKLQSCIMLEEGTWHDYFVEEAAATMTDVIALCDAASKEGFVWNDDLQAQYDSQYASMDAARISYNETYGTKLDMAAYIQRIYGDLVTEKVFETETKRSILAQAYIDQFVDSLEYSDAEIESAYNADKNAFDRVAYDYLRISGAATGDADKTAAMAEAKALAEELLAKVQNGETFENLSSAYEKATLTTSAGSAYSDVIFMKWLFEDSRKDGDVAILEDTDSSIYYVIRFNGRFRYDYNTVNVRHILVKLGTGSLTSEDAGYAEQQNLLKDFARSEAESIFAEWKSGAATEESFAALANEHSADGGSNTVGGLYEQVYKGQTVTEFDAWCFDESRKPGDTGIIYSEDTGYHIMYFVGEDRPYWELEVINSKMNADYTEWYTKSTEGYTYEINDFGMSAVG